MSLQGRFSGIASEAIARQLRDRLAQASSAHSDDLARQSADRRHRAAMHQRRRHRSPVLSRAGDPDRARLSRIAIGFPILLWLDWKMALSATALMPVIILFAIIFFRKVQGSFKKTDEAEGVMTAALQENLTGIRVVRAFARQEFEIERFTKKNADYRDRHWRLFIIMAVYWSTSDLMCITQFAAIVFIGAWRIRAGR